MIKNNQENREKMFDKWFEDMDYEEIVWLAKAFLDISHEGNDELFYQQWRQTFGENDD